MPQSQAEITALIATLNAGDIAEVEFTKNGCANTRSVKAMGTHKDGALFVESGKVRPGHIAGGKIWADENGVYFQPTMQQPCFRVTGVKTHRVLVLSVAA